jgi:hypothetical protein
VSSTQGQAQVRRHGHPARLDVSAAEREADEDDQTDELAHALIMAM